MGDDDQAKEYYNRALRIDLNCAECYNNLAVLEAASDQVSSVLYLKKAINLNETYADPYFNLATIMEQEGNYRSAVEYYKKYLIYAEPDNKELKEKVRSRIEDLVLNWE